jgi:hypothetical protein
LGGLPLCERFGRLFDLAAIKTCTVAEMFSLGWEAGGGRGCGGGSAVGVGGRAVGGASDFTSYCDFVG